MYGSFILPVITILIILKYWLAKGAGNHENSSYQGLDMLGISVSS